jgi:hypothetical protein
LDFALSKIKREALDAAAATDRDSDDLLMREYEPKRGPNYSTVGPMSNLPSRHPLYPTDRLRRPFLGDRKVIIGNRPTRMLTDFYSRLSKRGEVSGNGGGGSIHNFLTRPTRRYLPSYIWRQQRGLVNFLARPT